MSHTLVTILGKGREDRSTGYRTTIYGFPDGTKTEPTAFFGLALTRHLAPDAIVILGTKSSQWGVLVEHLATEGEEEDARLELMEAEAKAVVEQTLLDRVTPIMARAVGRSVMPKLIPFGQDADEQYGILSVVANIVPNGTVSVDVTHGFRHLGIIGFLSAFMLERVRNLTVRDLWYGALDMTRDGITPVLRLDGLLRVRRWLNALDRFDATGDYGVFAPLLKEDGVAADKADCLTAAAFHERTLNARDAARKIGTFLPVLEEPLAGASGLFQHRLAERLGWVKPSDLAEQQRKLAYQYLNRHDFIRAAIFAREAWVTKLCSDPHIPPTDYTKRKSAVDDFEAGLRNGKYSNKIETDYRTITTIRNALAHGTPPSNPRYGGMLKDPDRLYRELEAALERLLG